AVHRSGHAHRPSSFSGRRADRIDAARAGTDQCGLHTSFAQQRGDAIKSVSLTDSSQIKLYTALEKIYGARSIVESHILPACLLPSVCQLFIRRVTTRTAKEAPGLHQLSHGNVEGASRRLTHV